MIRFVSVDIDGCLNCGKNTEPNRIKLKKIKDILSIKKDQFSFSLNSGRDVHYVQQYAQLLSCTTPLICENGGLLYYPSLEKIMVHPSLTPSNLTTLHKLQKNIVKYIEKIYPGYTLETGKQTMISLNPPHDVPISHFYEKISTFVANNFPIFYVTRSESAVDISLKNIDKNGGLKIVLQELAIEYSEVCAIGDSISDIVLLQKVGYPACPKNADAQVKKICKYIATKDYEDGVLEILSRF